MKKSDLMNMLGTNVRVTYSKGLVETGILKYVDEFSEKHGWKKTDYFYVDPSPSCMTFKVSHVKKVEQI